MINTITRSNELNALDLVGRIALVDLNLIYPAWGSAFKITEVTASFIRGESVPMVFGAVADTKKGRYLMSSTETPEDPAAIRQPGGNRAHHHRKNIRAICDTAEEVNHILLQSLSNEADYYALCAKGREWLHALATPRPVAQPKRRP